MPLLKVPPLHGHVEIILIQTFASANCSCLSPSSSSSSSSSPCFLGQDLISVGLRRDIRFLLVLKVTSSLVCYNIAPDALSNICNKSLYVNTNA